MLGAALLAAVTLAQESGDLLPIGCPSPPGIEAHASDPDAAFVACTTYFAGVFAYHVDPSAPLAEELSIEPYSLPADLNGSLPDPGTSPFIDGVWIESEAWGWVTTNGHDTAAPFDPRTGQARSVLFEGVVRPSIPTARAISGSFTRTNGVPIASFDTNYTSDVLRVGNRLLVSTSNFATVGSNPVLNPGTVLLFDLDDSNPTLLVAAPASPAYVVTTDPNPTALTPLPGGRVAVTNTGRLVLSSPPSAGGPASIDVIDPAAGAIVASIPLGSSAPAFDRVAVDPSGSVGLFGSAVLRALYAVDLRGVAELALPAGNAQLQRPSCTGAGTPSVGGVPCAFERAIATAANPLWVPPCGSCSGATDGFVSAAEFGASGDFAVATEFNDGLAAFVAFDPANLGAPHRLLATRFGPPQVISVAPPAGTYGAETGPGPLLLVPSAGGGLDGTDVLWLTNTPTGTLGRGTAQGSLAAPAPDSDADGVGDALDSCPLIANPAQADADADGSGDPCQCGDATGDGRVQIDDLARVERFASGLGPALPAPATCNVAGLPGGGSGSCDAADADALREVLAGTSALPVPPLCGPATPP